jgi:hypothetical protein
MPGTDNAPTAADTLRWPSGASWHLGLAGELCGPGREEGLKIAVNVSFQAPKHAENCPQGYLSSPSVCIQAWLGASSLASTTFHM